MVRTTRVGGILFLFGVFACGAPRSGAPASAAAAPPAGGAGPATASNAEGDAGAAPGAPAGEALPKECAARDADVCMPESGFVKRLCNGSFPDVALRFFVGGTPWTRAYLTHDIDGWNAEGGSAARARLAFDEEVVILRRRTQPKGGIQVGSGGAGYLVLRVDGSCYTVDDLEVTRKRPPKPKSGPVTFRYLESPTQEALLKNARIDAAASKRRKECKGASSGEVSKACEKADAELARAVPEEVRNGMDLPIPKHVP